MVNQLRCCELVLGEHVNQQFYFLKDLEVVLVFDQDRGYDDLP
jgi:hypothetical protein